MTLKFSTAPPSLDAVYNDLHFVPQRVLGISVWWDHQVEKGQRPLIRKSRSFTTSSRVLLVCSTYSVYYEWDIAQLNRSKLCDDI